MRFPARRATVPQDRIHQARQRPAPDPAGEKRPPWAGRALAEGFGPSARQTDNSPLGLGNGLGHGGDRETLPEPLSLRPG